MLCQGQIFPFVAILGTVLEWTNKVGPASWDYMNDIIEIDNSDWLLK